MFLWQSPQSYLLDIFNFKFGFYFQKRVKFYDPPILVKTSKHYSFYNHCSFSTKLVHNKIVNNIDDLLPVNATKRMHRKSKFQNKLVGQNTMHITGLSVSVYPHPRHWTSKKRLLVTGQDYAGKCAWGCKLSNLLYARLVPWPMPKITIPKLLLYFKNAIKLTTRV